MKKIFVLHGWAYSTERWKPLIDELGKNNIEIEMLKIPGLTAPLNEVWTIDNYINWLEQILKKEDGIILLGHSNGGLISLAYALKHSKKVSKLILIDSTGIYHNELSIRLKRFIFATGAKIGKKLTSSKLMKKALYKLARAHDYENASPIVRETMKNLISVDYSQFLKNLRIPTIIIWGKKDQVTPVSDGKIIHHQIENSKLYIVDDARHSPQLTHSVEVARIILNNL